MDNVKIPILDTCQKALNGKKKKRKKLNMPVKVSPGKLIPRMWPDKL